MIAFVSVSKQYGGQILFVKASFQVNPGEKIGLVGPNGAGKSTIFRLIVGEELPDDGLIEKPRKLTLGYFRQDVGDLGGRSILAETVGGAGEAATLGEEMTELEAKMGEERHLVPGLDNVRGGSEGLGSIARDFAGFAGINGRGHLRGFNIARVVFAGLGQVPLGLQRF